MFLNINTPFRMSSHKTNQLCILASRPASRDILHPGPATSTIMEALTYHQSNIQLERFYLRFCSSLPTFLDFGHEDQRFALWPRIYCRDDGSDTLKSPILGDAPSWLLFKKNSVFPPSWMMMNDDYLNFPKASWNQWMRLQRSKKLHKKGDVFFFKFSG